MQAANGNPTTLTIHRLHAQYLVSSEHPNPQSVSARLDQVAGKTLPGTLAAALSRLLPLSAPDVWLIRWLELDLDVGLDLGEEAVTRSWAGQIASSIAEIVDGQRETNEVLHFRDRAAYLARFLLDLADGLAWGKWYYRRFDGLRPLPVSAAARTAVCEDSETGSRALMQIPEPGLARVIESLNEQDAKLVLKAIAEAIPATGGVHS